VSDTDAFGNPVTGPDPDDATSAGEEGTPTDEGSRTRRPLVVVLVLVLLAVLALGGAWLFFADADDAPPDAAPPVATPAPSDGSDLSEDPTPSPEETSSEVPDDAPVLQSGANVRDPFEPLVEDDSLEEGAGAPGATAPSQPGATDPGATGPGVAPPGGVTPPGGEGQPGGTGQPGDGGRPGAAGEPGGAGAPGAAGGGSGGTRGGQPGGQGGEEPGSRPGVSVLRVLAVDTPEPERTADEPTVKVTVDGTAHRVRPLHAFADGFYLRGVYDGQCGVFRYDGGMFFDLCVGQSREIGTGK
jgi:hypothetical protein